MNTSSSFFATSLRSRITAVAPCAARGAAMLVLAASASGQGPVQAFGLPHTPLGNATVQWNSATRELELGWLGSTMQDGVEIVFPGGDGWHGFSPGTPITVPAGSELAVRAYHDPAGAPTELVAEIQVRGVSAQRREVSMSLPGYTTATVEGYLRGRLVFRETGRALSGGQDFELLYYAEYDCTSVWVVRTNAGEIETGTDDLSESEVRLPSGGGGVVDHVVVSPEGSPSSATSIDRVRILGRNLGPLRLQRETVQRDGVECAALGDAALMPAGGAIGVANIGSSGQDGVEFSSYHDRMTGRPSLRRGFSARFDNLDPSLYALPAGAALRLGATGVMQGAAGVVSLGSLQILDVGADLEMTADFSPVGAATQRIEIWRQGQRVVALPGHSGAIARFQRWPTRCAKERVWDDTGLSCFAGGWGQDETIQVLGTGGGTYVGDELRVLAEGPGFVEELTSLSIIGDDLFGWLRFTELRESPSAISSAYGTSCGGSLASDEPILGTTLHLVGTGLATSTIAVALIGLPQVPGLPLDFIGMPGCELLVAPLVSIVAFSDATGTAVHPIPIPAAPDLIGAAIGAQDLFIAPAANPLGVLATNGLQLVLDY